MSGRAAAPHRDPGSHGSDVVAALSHLAEMINQRLRFWPSGGE
jgi:hypothetical protein